MTLYLRNYHDCIPDFFRISKLTCLLVISAKNLPIAYTSEGSEVSEVGQRSTSIAKTSENATFGGLLSTK